MFSWKCNEVNAVCKAVCKQEKKKCVKVEWGRKPRLERKQVRNRAKQAIRAGNYNSDDIYK